MIIKFIKIKKFTLFIFKFLLNFCFLPSFINKNPKNIKNSVKGIQEIKFFILKLWNLIILEKMNVEKIEPEIIIKIPPIIGYKIVIIE